MRTPLWILLTAVLLANLNCQIAQHETANSTAAESRTDKGEATDEKTALGDGISAILESNQQPSKTTEASEQSAPEELLKQLYKQHQEFLNNTESGKGAIIQGKSRSPIDKYFDKNLADLIWKDLTAHKGEIGAIDFDLFTNSQNPNITNLTVGQAKIQGGKATVPVSFNNYGKKETITYQLTKQNDSWKISDINYHNLQSLLQYFKEAASNTPNTANTNSSEKFSEGIFEGTYQVGKTTCTVKPTKTAIEVRWAKGSGVMLFFYTGQGVLEYSSEDKGKGIDTFTFDDASLTTGKFIRADGVEMPVKKK